MDIVPRLSNGTLTHLSSEIRACAEESGAALDEDVQHYVERLTSVWAPRFRDGTPLRDLPSALREHSHSHEPGEVCMSETAEGAGKATEDLQLDPDMLYEVSVLY